MTTAYIPTEYYRSRWWDNRDRQRRPERKPTKFDLSGLLIGRVRAAVKKIVKPRLISRRWINILLRILTGDILRTSGLYRKFGEVTRRVRKVKQSLIADLHMEGYIGWQAGGDEPGCYTLMAAGRVLAERERVRRYGE